MQSLITDEQTEGPVCHEHGIRGYGNPASGVFVVGIAPGRDEATSSGHPLTGPSGKLFDAILKAVDWSRDKVYATNLICWWKDEPSQTDILGCQSRLMQEIAQYKPRLIVTLGAIPCQFFTESTLGKAGGCVRWDELYEAYILPTYHPAAVLRGGGFIHDIVKDLAKIPRIVDWKPGAPLAQVEYDVVQSRGHAQELLDSLPRDRPIGIDIESDSKSDEKIDPDSDPLLCIAISTGNMTWTFPIEVLQGLNWPDGVQWTFHNGSFDTRVIYNNLGVWLPICHDTMLMSYSLDERQGEHSLKTLSRGYLGAGFYEAELKPYRKTTYANVPKDILYRYNAQDACYTQRLCTILRQMQEQDDVTEPYDQVLLPAVNMFKEVQQRGVFIDQKYLETLAVEWGEKYLKDEDDLVEMARQIGYPGDINLNSPKQLSHLLYSIIGLPGGPSTGQKVLELLVDEHPFVQKLMDFRHLDHMYGTYILGIMDDIKADGRVHADVLLHGTVTGRLSYRDPPLQTIPKDYTLGEEFGRIRHIFAAGDDDHVIVEADLSQAEIWSAYGYSRDPQMLADLQSGDYHRQTASTVFNKPPEDVSDLDRYNTKFITFGIMYGREAPSLARGELHCTIPEAQRYLDRWFLRYPIYREWWYSMQQRAVDDGELVSITGRKRRFRLVRGEEAYRTLKQAVNFPIQSSASDCVLTAAVDLHNEFKQRKLDSHVLFLVHDCIVSEVHVSHLEECLHLIKDTMSSPRFDGFPGIPVDIKVGRTWGAAKKVKWQ